MPSKECDIIVDLYTRLSALFRSGSLTLELHRYVAEQFGSIASEPTSVTYEEVVCPGSDQPSIWCKPIGASPAVILYLHGGGYASGTPSSHRKLAGHLAKRSNCLALVLGYRLAPESPFPAQIDDALAAYTWLLHDKKIPATQIAFAGDSAGGGLSVALALASRSKGMPGPAAVACFSPWVDMRITGESHKSNIGKDLLVSDGAMPGTVQIYVGNSSLDDPLLDLLNANYKDFPPTYLTSGGSEVFRDDAAMLANAIRSAGSEVQFKLVDGMQHVWVFMAGNAPEADKTLEEAAQFIRGKLSI